MTAPAGTVAEVVLAAVRKVPGLRPATPQVTRMPWDLELLAVDVAPGDIEVRLVALVLPLGPVLRLAETVVRQALADVGRERTLLRLVITDVDATAFDQGP
ncbi:MAG: hypothetical protein WBA97_25055 [Actinophytocola sp.]|uniref:hypothetical protein n=1 Tax=Actinophytocola sp. TaxID=1872138 RepID=UPI003C713580